MRAGEAKLCACVRDVPPVAGLPAGNFSVSSAVPFSFFLLLYVWVLSGFGVFLSCRGSVLFMWVLRVVCKHFVVFAWVLSGTT